MKTKRIVSLFITLCMLMSLVPYTMVYADSTFGGGIGTEGNPYQISTAQQLVELATNVNNGNDYSGKYFELDNDIKLSGDWTPIGTYTNNKPFKGTFDGAGKKITGLHNDTAANYLGLFGYVGEGGVIKNLGVKGTVSGLNNTAGIAAKNEGTIDGCYMTGMGSELVQGGAGSNTGGIVGENSGTVKNCYNDTMVQGNNNVGGIVGINKSRGIVEKCYNKVKVGGGFGEVDAGGIVGENSGTVRNCYNTANVDGNDNVGGIVGNNNGGTVEYCYSRSYNIQSGGSVGGIVGTGDASTKCYYLKTSGFSGTTINADGATAVNEEDFKKFKDKTLFDGWNFGDDEGVEPVWKINLFLQRPILCTNPEFTYAIEGKGTKDDPFLIPDLKTLEILRYYTNEYTDRNTFENVYFKMTADIDMSTKYSESGESWTPIGYYAPIGYCTPFCGKFDGGGHNIKDLYINDTFAFNAQGLFGYVGTGGVIENLSVSGKVTTTGNNVGGIGGIVGYNKGTITNCYNTAAVSGSSYVGSSYVGGVCGNNNGTIENCYYLEGTASTGIGLDNTSSGIAVSKTTDQFAGGEVAYILQSVQTADTEGDPIPQVWGQKLTGETKDALPVLTSDADKKVYKVTFATLSNSTYAVKYANKNYTVVLPQNPTVSDGYVFYKWSKTADGEAFTAETPVTEDITVYAVGEEKYGKTDNEKTVTTTYGTEKTQDLSDYTVFAMGTPSAGKFIYTIESGNDTNLGATIDGDTLTIPNTAAVGTYNLTIKATEESPVVSLMSVEFGTEPLTFDVKVKVEKADSSVTAAPTAKTGLVYNGYEQALVTAGNATGGTMQYSLDNLTWLTDIPTGTDAKEYTVYYKVVGDSNHNDVDAENITVTIAKLPEDTPTIAVNYTGETLTGFESGKSYTISVISGESTVESESTFTPTDGKLPIADYIGKKISIVKKASDNNHADSTAQTFTVPSRPIAPTGITATDPSTIGGTGSIEGITANMEYSTDGGNTWTQGNGNAITGIAGGTTYLVRYKATDSSFKSGSYSISIEIFGGVKETTPNIKIDYASETLTGFEDGGSYTIGVAEVNPTDGTLEAESYMGQTISIVKKGNGTTTNDSDKQELDIPSRPAAPTLTIDNSTEQVTIPTGYLYGSTDNNYANITTPGSGEGVTVAPNSSIYIYKAAVTEGDNKAFKSEIQTLTAPGRTTAPTGDNFNVKQPETFGDKGSIEGITSDMEYSTDDGITWHDGGGTIENIEGDTKYLIRYKDNDQNFKSDSYEIKINTFDGTQEATPNIKIDYASETLTGFESGSYTIGGAAVTPTDGKLPIADYIGKKISIVKKGNGTTTNDSDKQELDIPSRPAAPNLTIKNSTEQVTIPTGYLYGSTDNNYANITTPGSGEGVTVEPNTSIYICKAAVTEGDNKAFKSEIQTLTAPGRTTAPTGDNFTVKQPETFGDTGSIEGITSDMEYSKDDGITWLDGDGAIENIEGDTKYLIRYKENDRNFKSDSYEIIINTFVGTKEAKPNIKIDYASETLTGFEDGGSYSINGIEVTPTDGTLEVGSYMGQTISIVKKGNGTTTNNSEPQTFTVSSRSTAPTGIKAGYGIITGVTNKMEYKLSTDSNWTAVTGRTITGLLTENYDVRIAATDSSFASEIVTVTVKEKSNSGSSFGGSSTANNYAVIVKAGKGGSASGSNKRVTAGDSVTITSVPDDGYKIDRVTVNGTYYGNEEITTIASVNEDITVLVTFAKTSTEEKTSTEDWVNPFDDVKESDWFYENVKWVNKNGLMNGTSKNMFSPTADVTRGMFVTVLYRIEGEPQVSGVSRFTDVNSAAYYSKAVIWAESNGIVKGYTDTEFAPDAFVLREQIAAILYRYAAYKGYDVSKISDITSYNDCGDISEYAIKAVEWAVGMGIISGNPDNTIAPLNNATRAEIAAMIQRFIEANK